jgi:hypothetical protein
MWKIENPPSSTSRRFISFLLICQAIHIQMISGCAHCLLGSLWDHYNTFPYLILGAFLQYLGIIQNPTLKNNSHQTCFFPEESTLFFITDPNWVYPHITVWYSFSLLRFNQGWHSPPVPWAEVGSPVIGEHNYNFTMVVCDTYNILKL